MDLVEQFWHQYHFPPLMVVSVSAPEGVYSLGRIEIDERCIMIYRPVENHWSVPNNDHENVTS